MRSLHNIEKSAFKRAEYVGYAAGRVYRIRKTGVGGWEAIERDSGATLLRAATLAEISDRLTSAALVAHSPRNAK